MNPPRTGNPPPLIRWLEKRFSRRPPRLAFPAQASAAASDSRPLKDGATVAVVGGGLAGPVFARQLLALTRERGPAVRVVLFDQTDCNYCAGLMTALARSSLLALCDLEVPEEVILTEIEGCIYLNSSGSTVVNAEHPLVSMLRTDRFGEAGFDDALKYRILAGMEAERERLEIIEPVTVSEIQIPRQEGSGWVGYRHQGERRRLEADVVVMACGLRSLNRPMMNDFIAQTGYVTPKLMDASVTEIDATEARHNLLGKRALIVDNLVPEAMVAIIPKRPTWITVSSLHRRLTREDLTRLFAHPAVKRWIDLPRPASSLRCNLICPARVFTAPAKNFYGDGWLALGDLNGYGRVLKDGYFASMVGASLAARTLAFWGSSAKALAGHYHAPLARAFPPYDNRAGMALFYLNERLSRRRWFPPLFLEAARAEEDRNPYGGLVHAGLRSLLTGAISYRTGGLIFLAGLFHYYCLHPGQLLSHFFFGSRDSEGLLR